MGVWLYMDGAMYEGATDPATEGAYELGGQADMGGGGYETGVAAALILNFSSSCLNSCNMLVEASCALAILLLAIVCDCDLPCSAAALA